MSNQQALLSNAVIGRFRELCAMVSQLVPADFEQMSGFVSDVQTRLGGAAATGVPSHLGPPTNWLESDLDCLTSLRHLALGESMQIRKGQRPETESFLLEIRSTLNNGEQRFQLLTQRYACPLNFALPSESQTREYVLERLMVQDRGRIEKNSKAVADSDDHLLRLNLIAVQALLTNDLRFLDALNYYYELIPSNWRPHAQHNWLMVSCFALYARALTARF
jgi:hypothetical protein